MPKIIKPILNNVILASILMANATSAHSPPNSARVFFKNLKDGATISSPFMVALGIEGFGITTAGDSAKRKHTAGHHHLLVDMDKLPDMDQPLPYNPNIIHYDNGETAVMVELPPGQHTLQMLLADEEHEPHDPPLLSKRISITVK